MAYEFQIQQEALRQGVPPELALAVARRESGFNQFAVGKKGEIGLFQLMPSTAIELGVNPAIPSENIEGGISYLRQQYERFGDWALALAAYNAGASRVESGAIPVSTQGYVADILGSTGWGDDPGLTYRVDVTGRADDGFWDPIQATFLPEGNMMVVALVVLAVGVLVMAKS